MDDRISIIVPTYNRKVMLQRLLESFGKLQCPCPLEFIIVDDCSDDGIRALVEDWKATINFADIKYHRLSSRSGPARARNAGISLSTGNILAFTDSDCMVDPLWVEQLYRHLTSRPEYAGVGGRVLPLHDDIYSTYNTVFRCLEPPKHIEAVIGANCMFWKQPVIDAGMFDENFFHPGGEEIALCMKLWIKGYRFGFEEQAVVYHDYRQNLPDFIRTFYHYGVGERIILTNWPAEYFQYMQYPEKMHNYVAFINSKKFIVLFFIHLIYGTFKQYSFLANIPLTRNVRLKLNSLYGIHQLSYHLGRGTFSGTLVHSVQQSLMNDPGCLLILNSNGNPDPSLLEITNETVPEFLKPGQRIKAAVTIKNISNNRWISTEFPISLLCTEANNPLFRAEISPKLLIPPGLESVFEFRFVSPKEEKDHIVHLFLSSHQGMPISNKIEKKIIVTSNPCYLDAEITDTKFPKEMVPKEQVFVFIMLKNTGMVEWSEKNKIRLGSENDASGTGALFGNFRVTLPPDVCIPPGCATCFTFRLTAPQNPGRYLLRYQMVCENNSWFGEVIEQRIEVKAR
jgi:glycosyltransferase involved in cell wall biosynthesis